MSHAFMRTGSRRRSVEIGRQENSSQLLDGLPRLLLPPPPLAQEEEAVAATSSSGPEIEEKIRNSKWSRRNNSNGMLETLAVEGEELEDTLNLSARLELRHLNEIGPYYPNANNCRLNHPSTSNATTTTNNILITRNVRKSTDTNSWSSITNVAPLCQTKLQITTFYILLSFILTLGFNGASIGPSDSIVATTTTYTTNTNTITNTNGNQLSGTNARVIGMEVGGGVDAQEMLQEKSPWTTSQLSTERPHDDDYTAATAFNNDDDDHHHHHHHIHSQSKSKTDASQPTSQTRDHRKQQNGHLPGKRLEEVEQIGGSNLNSQIQIEPPHLRAVPKVLPVRCGDGGGGNAAPPPEEVESSNKPVPLEWSLTGLLAASAVATTATTTTTTPASDSAIKIKTTSTASAPASATISDSDSDSSGTSDASFSSSSFPSSSGEAISTATTQGGSQFVVAGQRPIEMELAADINGMKSGNSESATTTSTDGAADVVIIMSPLNRKSGSSTESHRQKQQQQRLAGNLRLMKGFSKADNGVEEADSRSSEASSARDEMLVSIGGSNSGSRNSSSSEVSSERETLEEAPTIAAPVDQAGYSIGGEQANISIRSWNVTNGTTNSEGSNSSSQIGSRFSISSNGKSCISSIKVSSDNNNSTASNGSVSGQADGVGAKGGTFEADRRQNSRLVSGDKLNLPSASDLLGDGDSDNSTTRPKLSNIGSTNYQSNDLSPREMVRVDMGYETAPMGAITTTTPAAPLAQKNHLHIINMVPSGESIADGKMQAQAKQHPAPESGHAPKGSLDSAAAAESDPMREKSGSLLLSQTGGAIASAFASTAASNHQFGPTSIFDNDLKMTANELQTSINNTTTTSSAPKTPSPHIIGTSKLIELKQRNRKHSKKSRRAHVWPSSPNEIDHLMSTLRLEDMISRSSEPFWLGARGNNGMGMAGEKRNLTSRVADLHWIGPISLRCLNSKRALKFKVSSSSSPSTARVSNIPFELLRRLHFEFLIFSSISGPDDEVAATASSSCASGGGGNSSRGNPSNNWDEFSWRPISTDLLLLPVLLVTFLLLTTELLLPSFAVPPLKRTSNDSHKNINEAGE